MAAIWPASLMKRREGQDVSGFSGSSAWPRALKGGMPRFSGPVAMRVSTADIGKETFDEQTKATESGPDHRGPSWGGDTVSSARVLLLAMGSPRFLDKLFLKLKDNSLACLADGHPSVDALGDLVALGQLGKGTLEGPPGCIPGMALTGLHSVDVLGHTAAVGVCERARGHGCIVAGEAIGGNTPFGPCASGSMVDLWLALPVQAWREELRVAKTEWSER